MYDEYHAIEGFWSLSSRRAWIEICGLRPARQLALGRSPHGERGLKYPVRAVHHRCGQSLSSRRAWIEMFHLPPTHVSTRVALLTESVD